MNNQIYEPAEDSYFLAETTKKFLKNKSKDIKVLDMGTGSGIQSDNLIKLGIKPENITAVDINKKALQQVKQLGVNIIESNLFDNVGSSFDLILFNPPYLPANKHDRKPDTTGGKKGNEIIIRFISQLSNYLTTKGVALFLTSSLTPISNTLLEIKKQYYKTAKIATKKLFFEELSIWELKI